jgi:MFS family permease
MLVGRWADRHGRPLLPLAVCAAIAAFGLLGMALAHGLFFAIAAYATVGLASTIFLALHAAQTLRVLPRPERRGRDLGLFNLTNTVPSVIMSGFTLALVPKVGFSGLFVLFAGLSLIAALLLVSVRLPAD